jgi:polar amino acid transport system ATP-binding protein
VLSDVSFQVDKGETICVLGPSGSGKSTLLRCINWLERPDAGQIYLNGERVGINGAGIVMSDRDLSRSEPASAWCFSISRCGPTSRCCKI